MYHDEFAPQNGRGCVIVRPTVQHFRFLGSDSPTPSNKVQHDLSMIFLKKMIFHYKKGHCWIVGRVGRPKTIFSKKWGCVNRHCVSSLKTHTFFSLVEKGRPSNKKGAPLKFH